MGEEKKEKEKKEAGEGEKNKEEEKGEKKEGRRGEGGGWRRGREEGREKKEEENPEIVLKVDMHCEGCARKVQRALRGFPGVEEVHTDSKSRKAVVKGKAADAVKVSERILKKSGKKVEIISPLPKPPPPEEKEEPKPQEKKEEEPVVVTIVLSIRMHCESCAQVVQRRIHKMKGVESAETDLLHDQVTVKGIVDPAKLVDYVYKQIGKQATIVPPPPPPPPEEKKEEEKKEEKGEDGKKEGEDESKGGEEEKKGDVKKSEYWPQRYSMEYYAYPPPQMFSDENPNACSVM